MPSASALREHRKYAHVERSDVFAGSPRHAQKSTSQMEGSPTLLSHRFPFRGSGDSNLYGCPQQREALAVLYTGHLREVRHAVGIDGNRRCAKWLMDNLICRPVEASASRPRSRSMAFIPSGVASTSQVSSANATWVMVPSPMLMPRPESRHASCSGSMVSRKIQRKIMGAALQP